MVVPTQPLTEAQKAVIPFLAHVEVARPEGCSCPATSWAPCGGQYEGHYDPKCAFHRVLGSRPMRHYPSGCPEH